MKWIVFILCAAVTTVSAQSVNPAIAQSNIGSTICVHGWTKTVRPPVSYTNRIKRGLLAKRHLPWSTARRFELDHRIPLEVGGHPTDRRNLWLQPWGGPNGARAKDAVETRMKRMVCSGAVSLVKAQACLGHDWKSCPKGAAP